MRFLKKTIHTTFIAFLFGIVSINTYAANPIVGTIPFGNFKQVGGTAKAELYLSAIDAAILDPKSSGGLYFDIVLKISGLSANDEPLHTSPLAILYHRYSEDTCASLYFYPIQSIDMNGGKPNPIYVHALAENFFTNEITYHYLQKNYSEPISKISFFSGQGNLVEFVPIPPSSEKENYWNFRRLHSKINEHWYITDDDVMDY